MEQIEVRELYIYKMILKKRKKKNQKKVCHHGIIGVGDQRLMIIGL